MRKCALGFTLVELLVVVAIIAILTNFVVASGVFAKRRAGETVSLSNLRQCSQALLIYMGDSSELPSYQAAQVALAKAPTSDPADYWHVKPGPDSAPMVGSYAYIMGVQQYTHAEYLGEVFEDVSRGATPWLAGLWHADYQSIFLPDSAIYEPGYGKIHACTVAQTCLLPNRINYGFADGSARTLSWPDHHLVRDGKTSLMVWQYVFSPALKREGVGRWQ